MHFSAAAISAALAFGTTVTAAVVAPVGITVIVADISTLVGHVINPDISSPIKTLTTVFGDATKLVNDVPSVLSGLGGASSDPTTLISNVVDDLCPALSKLQTAVKSSPFVGIIIGTVLYDLVNGVIKTLNALPAGPDVAKAISCVTDINLVTSH